MTKVALITDTHWGVRNASPVFFDYFARGLENFFDVLEKEDIKHVIHLGDLFDQRKSINVLAVNRCRNDFLDRLDKMSINTHIIVGNHDVFYKNTNDVSSVEEFVGKRYDSIHIYTEPKVITIDGTKIQLLPWISNVYDPDILNVIAKSPADILMGHLELTGFEMFRGSVSDHGMDRNLFNRYDVVCSGHFHHKSSVGNINYLGAFAEYTWADHRDPRGFHIFDTDDRSLTFIQNEESLFRMISFDDRKPDIVDFVNNFNYSSIRNTYVKVVNASNKNNPYAFDQFIDRLHSESPLNISVIEDMESFVEDNPEDAVDETADTPSILSKYIDGLTLSVDPDRMKSFMKEVYVEAIMQDKAL
jgi:DNA repair exonuclease SbcCD nuclease subunit